VVCTAVSEGLKLQDYRKIFGCRRHELKNEGFI